MTEDRCFDVNGLTEGNFSTTFFATAELLAGLQKSLFSGLGLRSANVITMDSGTCTANSVGRISKSSVTYNHTLSRV